MSKAIAVPEPLVGLIASNVRAEIARKRTPNKVSQAQIGKTLGMTQSTVSRRLNGEVEWRAIELHMLARLLQVPVGSFYPANPGETDYESAALTRLSYRPKTQIASGVGIRQGRPYIVPSPAPRRGPIIPCARPVQLPLLAPVAA